MEQITERKKEKKSSANPDLLHGPIAKTLLAFSVPFMLATLLQTLYTTIDTIIVGQILGSVGLSAVSNGSQLMQMLYMICIGFSTAGQVLIAQYKGADQPQKIEKVFGTLLILEVMLSVLIGLVCLGLSHPLLTVLNTPQEAFSQAAYYTMICSGGMIFTGLFNMFSAILRGLGDSRHPLLFVAISSVLNIFLDLLFISVFHWNVAGAALATVLGQAVSVIFSIIYFRRHPQVLSFPFAWKAVRLDGHTARRLISIGIPMAIQSGAIQFSFLFVNGMVNSLGVDVSAALGVTQKLRNIPGILTQGLQMGSSSMIGQNWGAGQKRRVQQTVLWCIVYAGVVALLFGSFFMAAPVLSFRLFTQDEAVLSLAVMCMFTVVLELPAKVLMPGCQALISAQGFVAFSFVIAMVDAFVGRVLCCWLFGTFFGLGAFGFFLGCSIGTYLTAIPVFVYYVSGLWKRRKVLA